MTMDEIIIIAAAFKEKVVSDYNGDDAEGLALTLDFFNTVILLANKEKPKKPKEAKDLYPPEQFECPVCGCCVGRHKTLRKINDAMGEGLTDCKMEFKHCPECGQHIDWGHDDDG